jgi:hypothetical protein
MPNELSMNGRKKIETLQKEFTEKFNYLTLVFRNEDGSPVDVQKTLAEIRTKKGADISIVASLKLDKLERNFLDHFGLYVEVAYLREGNLVHYDTGTGNTLNEANYWCEANGCERLDMEDASGQSVTPKTESTADPKAEAGLQQKLFKGLKLKFPDAVAKKIDKDNYLDIHVPSVNERYGTHLGFNTSGGVIKIVFYCRDGAFVDTVISKSDRFEQYSQGLRLLGNPEFEDAGEAVDAAVEFLIDIQRSVHDKYSAQGRHTGTKKAVPRKAEHPEIFQEEEAIHPTEDLTEQDSEETEQAEDSVAAEFDSEIAVENLDELDIKDRETADDIAEYIRKGRILTNLHYVNKALQANGFEVDNHQAYFFDSQVLISDMSYEGFLLVNMDGFYSNCIDKEIIQPIFSWSGVDDIEYSDHPEGCSIDIHSPEGTLTIRKVGSKSLKVLHAFYQNVWKEINSEFKEEPMIIWNKVWEIGIEEVGFDKPGQYFTFQSEAQGFEEDVRMEEKPTITKSETEFIDNYHRDFMCDNIWSRKGYPLDIIPFPNVFSSEEDKGKLFRNFSKEEVERIVRRIRSTGSLILLPFVREMLSRKISINLKPPFWFIPLVGYGNDIGSILYFCQDGFFNCYKGAYSLINICHVDMWKDISVQKGYNGLFDSHEDDDRLSSLRVEWHNPRSGNNGAINVVEFHGENKGCTLEIVKAIWDSAWKSVVERSKGSAQFLLGPPPNMETFNSWEELLRWAEEG